MYLRNYSDKLAELYKSSSGELTGFFRPDYIFKVRLNGSRRFSPLAKDILSGIFYREAIMSVRDECNYYYTASNKMIAKRCGAALSTVAHTIGRLKKQGWIRSKFFKLGDQRYPVRTLFLNMKKFWPARFKKHEITDSDIPY